MKNKILLTLLTLFPSIIFAADFTFKVLAGNIYKSFVGIFVNLLLAFAMLFFAWGVAMFIVSEGDKKESAKNRLFWAIIALLVMVSFWGILRIFNDTFLDDFESQSPYKFESTYTQFTPSGSVGS